METFNELAYKELRDNLYRTAYEMVRKGSENKNEDVRSDLLIMVSHLPTDCQSHYALSQVMSAYMGKWGIGVHIEAQHSPDEIKTPNWAYVAHLFLPVGERKGG